MKRVSIGGGLEAPPIPELYERCSDYWEALRARGPFLEKNYVDWVIRERPPGSPVLDAGCGSGHPIAAYLAAQGVSVTGCDVSPAMIGKSRALLPDQEWIVADMRTLDLGRKFGALIAWDSFFHLSRGEQRQVLPRFRKHLLPGGVLLFTSGPKDGEQIGALGGELLYHASLAPAEYREILSGLGFGRVEFCANDEACGNHSVWVAWVEE